MSVLCLDLPVFNYIREGIKKAAYKREVDEFYFYSIQNHFQHRDIETESLRLVTSWCDMNEKSYCEKYKKPYQQISKFIETKYVQVEILQFIKYLQCLRYNIEIEGEDLELLNNLITDAMGAYIGSLEAYKNAKWSE